MRNKDDPKLHRLREVELFRQCTPEALSYLASITDETTLDAGDVLCWEGEVPTAAYIIDQGEANVRIGANVLSTVGPGGIIGEMGLLDARPRGGTVVATSPMKVYVIDSRRFGNALDGVPTLARSLLRELTARVRGLDHERAQSQT
jgi:CRP-like cAMP-binding protein